MIKTTNTTAGKPISIICESSKHWSSYIKPIISMCFGFTILLLGTMKTGAFSSFLLIIGSINILYALSKILTIKSVQWILTDDGVTIKSGFLPWDKTYFEIPMMEIYESYYDNGGFWGNLLGYRHINIRRTDGSTSSLIEKQMINVEEMTKTINQYVYEFKKNNFPFDSKKAVNITDELLKLTLLLEKGVINQQQFIEQKNRLLDNY